MKVDMVFVEQKRMERIDKNTVQRQRGMRMRFRTVLHHTRWLIQCIDDEELEWR